MELTNREAYFQTKHAIEKEGLDISNNEICQLLEKASGFNSYTELTLNFDKKLANPEYFEELKSKLFSGQPIQYILNEAPFIDYTFYVDNRVLIPRVETEELVIRTIDLLKLLKIEPKNILDMCTGSGCIAIYLKSKFEKSEVYASDISKDALDVAKKNAEHFSSNIHLVQGDKLEPFLTNGQKFDVIISNPPYVQNKEDIEEKVKNHEPMNAIYSEDGTAFYEEIFKHYKEVLNEKFILAFEINYDQQDRLTELISKYFEDNINFSFVNDIYGRTRFLFIIRGYIYENLN